ncbi:MAG: hypothetical protein ACJ0GH_01975 [Alphaproteobacteria bacterium]|tara:strand:+ start:50 stop:424 length:375 start_codon:yes stop_codon:yes gene_type:complete
MEFFKNLVMKIDIEHYKPYMENTLYLVIFSILLTLILYFILSFALKIFFKKKDDITERKKPLLNEIIDEDNVKINDDNQFVDVLAAIEEEMAAIRELYVGGYISKGVYISETDRLYEKAKIFGL